MDSQSQPPVVPVPKPDNKPPIEISDKAVQDLLLIHGVQSGPKHQAKLPLKVIIMIAILVLLAAVSSYMLSGVGKGGTTGANQANSQSSNKTDENSGRGVTNEINPDVKSCSNPEVAVSEC